MKYTICAADGMKLSLAPTDEASEILQNLYILLNTVKGDVPCYREFGLDMTYMHMPMQSAQTMYVAAVAAAIRAFEPRVHLEEATFATDENDPSRLIPTLEVTIGE